MSSWVKQKQPRPVRVEDADPPAKKQKCETVSTDEAGPSSRPPVPTHAQPSSSEEVKAAEWHFVCDCAEGARMGDAASGSVSMDFDPLHSLRCSKCLCRVCKAPAYTCNRWDHSGGNHAEPSALERLLNRPPVYSTYYAYAMASESNHVSAEDWCCLLGQPCPMVGPVHCAIQLTAPAPTATHLVEVCIPVEAAGPEPLPALQSRMLPWGIGLQPKGAFVPPCDTTDALTLVLDRQIRLVPDHDKLPLPPPPEDRRVVVVTLVHYDGKHPPEDLTLTVPRATSVSELAARVKQLRPLAEGQQYVIACTGKDQSITEREHFHELYPTRQRSSPYIEVLDHLPGLLLPSNSRAFYAFRVDPTYPTMDKEDWHRNSAAAAKTEQQHAAQGSTMQGAPAMPGLRYAAVQVFVRNDDPDRIGYMVKETKAEAKAETKAETKAAGEEGGKQQQEEGRDPEESREEREGNSAQGPPPHCLNPGSHFGAPGEPSMCQFGRPPAAAALGYRGMGSGYGYDSMGSSDYEDADEDDEIELMPNGFRASMYPGFMPMGGGPPFGYVAGGGWHHGMGYGDRRAPAPELVADPILVPLAHAWACHGGESVQMAVESAVQRSLACYSVDPVPSGAGSEPGPGGSGGSGGSRDDGSDGDKPSGGGGGGSGDVGPSSGGGGGGSGGGDVGSGSGGGASGSGGDGPSSSGERGKQKQQAGSAALPDKAAAVAKGPNEPVAAAREPNATASDKKDGGPMLLRFNHDNHARAIGSPFKDEVVVQTANPGQVMQSCPEFELLFSAMLAPVIHLQYHVRTADLEAMGLDVEVLMGRRAARCNQVKEAEEAWAKAEEEWMCYQQERREVTRGAHTALCSLLTSQTSVVYGEEYSNTYVHSRLESSATDATGRRGHLRMQAYFDRAKAGVQSDAVLRTFEDVRVRTSSPDVHPLRDVFNYAVRHSQVDRGISRRQVETRLRAWGINVKAIMDALQTEEREAAPQPGGLTVELRPYQLQTLSFMLEMESLERGLADLLWVAVPPPVSPLLLPCPSTSNAAGQPDIKWWSPVLEMLCTNVPALPRGGFLAEEMGLGKTVEVLALVLANPAPPLEQMPPPGEGLFNSRATLVVAPVSLVGQWMDEAEAKTAGSLKIYMYHGQNRIKDPSKLASQYDIVVTTYAILSSDYSHHVKKSGGDPSRVPPLGCIRWHRLVLDEAHNAKSITAGQTKACIALRADRRWCCTGTPIAMGVDDLLGQLAVLHAEPFSNRSLFNDSFRLLTREQYSCFPARYLLSSITVRHTKQQVLGGEAVLNLPPKTEELVPVDLTPEEQRAYCAAYRDAREQYMHLRANGELVKRVLEAMALIMPMRRICSGGMLRQRDLRPPQLNLELRAGATSGIGGVDIIGGGGGGGGAAVAPAGNEECPICLDLMELPTRTPCNHWFCRECILSWLSSKKVCPLCRHNLARASLEAGLTQAQALATAARAARRAAAEAAGRGQEGQADGGPQEGGMAGEELAEPPGLACESKLRVLLRELRVMREADPSSKALIFSQFGGTLDWLQKRLPEEGFGFRTITGSMTLKKRKEAIEAFQGDPPTTVFLLSMRSGSVGINLTAASHVFLLDAFLNHALEEQAVGRAWRMGQTRPVTVKKLYAKGTVEEKIMEVVRKRREAAEGGGAEGGGGGGPSDGAGSSGMVVPSMGRHTQWIWPYGGQGQTTRAAAQDVAGSIKQDRLNLKLGELELLFEAPAFLGSFPPDATDPVADAPANVGAGTSGSTPAAAAAGGGAGGSGVAGPSAPSTAGLTAAPAAAAAAAGVSGQGGEQAAAPSADGRAGTRGAAAAAASAPAAEAEAGPSGQGATSGTAPAAEGGAAEGRTGGEGGAACGLPSVTETPTRGRWRSRGSSARARRPQSSRAAADAAAAAEAAAEAASHQEAQRDAAVASTAAAPAAAAGLAQVGQPTGSDLSDSDSAPWECRACTYVHEGGEARFLACALCATARQETNVTALAP